MLQLQKFSRCSSWSHDVWDLICVYIYTDIWSAPPPRPTNLMFNGTILQIVCIYIYISGLYQVVSRISEPTIVWNPIKSEKLPRSSNYSISAIKYCMYALIRDTNSLGTNLTPPINSGNIEMSSFYVTQHVKKLNQVNIYRNSAHDHQ